ncbi:MAG: 50S ribosomal protein L25/general stress protein Ctc, partial [Bacteroidetes bacterium]|nr:50S ribosomal protein L25/general stress protein Ctc [Bacteroidota bacterium]
MKTVSMSGALRVHVGKKDAKKTRREGKVPCVIYGGAEQIHFYTDEKAIGKILFTPEVFILKLSIGDKEYNTILQDIQYHPVTDRVLHADFLEILPGKKVSIAIPVKVEGVAPGVLKGGKLHKKLRKVKVKGFPEDMPDYLVVNIGELNIGDSIKVRNMQYPNLEFLDMPSSVIVSVKTARGAGATPEEEAAEAAP